MRQVMPHRNNIELRRTNSKGYFEIRWKNCSPALGPRGFFYRKRRPKPSRPVSFGRQIKHLYDYSRPRGHVSFVKLGWDICKSCKSRRNDGR